MPQREQLFVDKPKAGFSSSKPTQTRTDTAGFPRTADLSATVPASVQGPEPPPPLLTAHAQLTRRQLCGQPGLLPQLQRTYGNRWVQRMIAHVRGGDPIRQQQPHATGLPEHLKSGVEQLSGFSLDEVRVRYNSDAPARLNALAYTQGATIYVAPGQEKHLSHELWHVVQQKQGRVKPTFQLKGERVNDDDRLEHEAEVMGRNALQIRRPAPLAMPLVPQATNAGAQEQESTVASKVGGEEKGIGKEKTALYVRSVADMRKVLPGLALLPASTSSAVVIQRHHNLKLDDPTEDKAHIYYVRKKKDHSIVYVGQTCDQVGLQKRFQQHLDSGYHPNWSHGTHYIEAVWTSVMTQFETTTSEQFYIDDQRLKGNKALENNINALTAETFDEYVDEDGNPRWGNKFRPKTT